MSFFSFFTSSGIQSSKQEKHKIYKDINFKDYFKGLLIDENNTCEQLIKQIVPYQLGEDMHKFIVLVLITKEKQIVLQRILNPEQQPLKIIKFHNPLLDSYLLYAEYHNTKLLQEQIYHHETLKINCHVQSDQQEFQRQGVLQKKGKNGQYRDRIFKLMKDCLIYYRIEKNKQFKYCYVSLDTMSIEKSKDKNLVFELNVDQKVFTLKAQSKTDYDGWIYSLHNQIFKWKEIKLLNDFDKKIQNIQKTKVDAYKNAAAHSFTLKYLLKQNNYITNSFISIINQQNNPFDSQLLQFLILCQKIEDQEFLKFKSDLNIQDLTLYEERDTMHKQLIPLANNNPQFSLIDNSQLLIFKQTALNYFDKTYLSFQSDLVSKNQQRIPLQQQLLNLQVHNYNQYMQFPLPNFQLFWET